LSYGSKNKHAVQVGKSEGGDAPEKQMGNVSKPPPKKTEAGATGGALQIGVETALPSNRNVYELGCAPKTRDLPPDSEDTQRVFPLPALKRSWNLGGTPDRSSAIANGDDPEEIGARNEGKPIRAGDTNQEREIQACQKHPGSHHMTKR